MVLDTLTKIAKYARSLENELRSQNNSSIYPLGSEPSTRPEQEYPSVELEVSDTIKHLELLEVNESFFGNDSQLALVKQAMQIRNKYVVEDAVAQTKRPEFWEVYPVSTRSVS